MAEERINPASFPPHIASIVDDASQVVPNQDAIGVHPIGTFDAVIRDTEIKVTKDNDSWYIAVTFDTPAGSAIKRYNRGNKSEAAVNIAKGELSALQHATGIFIARAADHYAALRGGRCKIVVEPQKNPRAGDENKGYTEVRRVLDVQGNEPGKAAPQTGAQQTAPAQVQAAPASGWAAPAPAAQTQPAPAPAAVAQPGWAAPANGAAQAAPAPAPAGWAAPR